MQQHQSPPTLDVLLEGIDAHLAALAPEEAAASTRLAEVRGQMRRLSDARSALTGEKPSSGGLSVTHELLRDVAAAVLGEDPRRGWADEAFQKELRKRLRERGVKAHGFARRLKELHRDPRFRCTRGKWRLADDRQRDLDGGPSSSTGDGHEEVRDD